MLAKRRATTSRALVLERHRRHGDADVLGEQGHERIDVAGPVRTNELLDERLLGG